MAETKLKEQSMGYQFETTDFSGNTGGATSTSVISGSTIAITIAVPSYIWVTISGKSQNNTDTSYYNIEITKGGVAIYATNDAPVSSGIGQTFSMTYMDAESTPSTYTYGFSCYNAGGDTIGAAGRVNIMVFPQ